MKHRNSPACSLFGVHPLDLRPQQRVPSPSRRHRSTTGLPRLGLVAGRGGDRPLCAGRIDPISLPLCVDERQQYIPRRSSSAWAKKPPPCAIDISFARRSAGSSRSSALSRSSSSRFTPGPKTRIALRPAHPLVRRLRQTPKLRRHRNHRRPLRIVFRLMLQHHAYRSLPYLRRVPRCCS